MDEIKETQRYVLEIFKEFHRVCKENKLRYFAIGGTCIGAVRHKGFIPWDDDIDIAMPAEDYHRFISYYSKQLKKPFSVYLPSDAKHYTMSFAKIQNTETTFVECTVDDYPDRYIGVNLDLFPVYGLPSDEHAIDRIVRRNEFLRKVNIKRRLPFHECQSLGGRLLWLVLSPLRLFPFHFITDIQDKMLSKYSFETSDKIYFSWRLVPNEAPGTTYTYKNIFYYDDFKATVTFPFEDTEIDIPQGFDRYLTMDFGEYMKLPPVEAQVGGHPKAIIDFDKSYTYYVERRKSK